MPMTKPEATALLEEFQSSPQKQVTLANWLDYFGRLCAANALARGFHDDELGVTGTLALYWDDVESNELGAAEIAWLDSCILQAELARQASEVGEAVEAVRRPGPDSHCPQHSNFLVEEADVLIRVGDTCAKRDLPLGQAVVDKLLFNLSRPWKHGKNS